MEAGWPLPGPAAPPPAVTRPDPSSSTEPPNANTQRERDYRKHRLSHAIRDAHEEYHKFIGSVGRAAKRDYVPERRWITRRLPVGTTQLYEGGRLRLIPMPSVNPKDPLNLPTWRKWAAIVSMSFFGALAVATEVAMGTLLLPIFTLEYAGVDPHLIQQVNLTASVSASSSLSPGRTGALVEAVSASDWSSSAAANDGGGALLASLAVHMDAILAASLLPSGTTLPLPPSRLVSLLATLPLLTAAAAAYIQVPLSVAVGRRPVLLLASACAWAGALWAGLSSRSSVPSALVQHLAARGLVGCGAGAAGALVPLVAAQDLVFLHQRHTVLAVVFAAPALATAALSAAAPPVAATGDWRWLYFVLATLGFLAWLALVAFVPETRWSPRHVSTTQLCGGSSYRDRVVWAEDHHRPAPPTLDDAYGPRTLWTDLGVVPFLQRRDHQGVFGGFQWRHARDAARDQARTLLLPAVLWTAVLATTLLAAERAMTELTAAAVVALRAPAGVGGAFRLAGVGAGISLGAAGLVAVVLGGPVAGRLTLAVTRFGQRGGSDGQGRRTTTKTKTKTKTTPTASVRPDAPCREAEHNLPLLVLPLVLAVAGCFLFGAAGGGPRPLPVAVWVAAGFLVSTARLLVQTAGGVLLMESYPPWAGACLAHAHSLPLVAAFFLEGRTASFVARRGSLDVWAVYAEVLIVASLGLPALYFGGGRWLRNWAAGTVQSDCPDDVDDDDEEYDEEEASTRSGSPGSSSSSYSRSAVSSPPTYHTTASSVYASSPSPRPGEEESARPGRAL